MAEVDNLEIKIAASSTDAAKKVSDLAAALEKVKSAMSGSGMDKVAEKIQAIGNAGQQIKLTVDPESGKAVDALTEKVNALRNAAESAKGIKIASEMGDFDSRAVEETAKEVRFLQQALEKIKNNPFAANIKKQIEDATSSADSFKRAFASTDTIFDNLKNSAADAFSEIMAAHPKLAAVTLAIKAVYNTLKKYFDEIKKNFSKLMTWLKSVGQRIASLAKQAAKSFGGQLKTIGASVVSRFTKPFTKAVGVFNKWKNAIGRIAFYRLIRSAIKAVTDGFKTGIENLYQYSRLVNTEFAPAMDKLATSALYLKNSLGAMAAPLIQAVAPAVDLLVDKFVDLLNIIGKAFAAITGKNVYSQARKHAVEYEEAAEDAKKATEEFEKFLIGIDELTIIKDQNDKGKGASALEDYGSMFEEVELPDWAEEMRKEIEKDNWVSAGKSLAQHLNDMMDEWDAYGWGMRLGQKINRALQIAYGFLKTFDFEGFGKKLAQGLNGLFDTIDWGLLGKTFGAGWNAIINTAYGFVTEFNWSRFGNYIATAINGFISEIDLQKAGATLGIGLRGILSTAINIVANTDWATYAKKFGDAVNAFLTEYATGQENGYDFGVLLATAINKGFLALDSFLDSGALIHLVNVLRRDITDFITTVELDDAAATLARLLDQLVNGAIDLFGDTDAWANFGKKIGDSLREFFMGGNDWLSDIGTLVGTAIHSAATSIENFANQFQPSDWEELGQRIAQSINNFFTSMTPEDWGNLGEALHSLAEGLINAAKTAIQNIDWSQIKEALSSFLDGLDITQLQRDFSRLMRLLYDNIAPTVMTMFTEIGRYTLQGFVNGFREKVNEAVENIQAFFGNIIDAAKQKLDSHSPSRVFEEIGGNVVEGFTNGISENWQNLLSMFSEKISALVKSAGSWGAEIVSGLASGISGAIGKVKSAVSGLASSIKQYIHFSEPDVGPLSDFHTYMPDMVSGMAKGIRENIPYATSAVAELTKSISNQFAETQPYGISGGPSFKANNIRTNYETTYGAQNGPQGTDYEDSASGARDELVGAILAAAQQVVKAINDKDTTTYLDGKQMARSLYSHMQRYGQERGESLTKVGYNR